MSQLLELAGQLSGEEQSGVRRQVWARQSLMFQMIEYDADHPVSVDLHPCSFLLQPTERKRRNRDANGVQVSCQV